MSITYSAGRSARRGVVSFLREVGAAIGEGLEFVSRYKALETKTDGELAALGLTREDLPRVAVQGWKKR
ncbi:hypothetical protein PQJ75_19665 [Rhodoplanes sp. TEM]|uniref:DUF1127 domain-containing protein n=1 Tax=Rhodoplanes tepidamans TaxID=200616 RepID=A0ABT5JH47_RHOTP|nr:MULTISPECIES: hypothetical protein [Rhodoplanes]MDC7789031.1 hypothetical protein [Rhodoplanes tepidamans]MDC7985954.1 hypothetical protein [Rhodoplanes sp. TEM]MDQ0355259.1 hypothetical protein [Rhodoplanes tepidamans]